MLSHPLSDKPMQLQHHNIKLAWFYHFWIFAYYGHGRCQLATVLEMIHVLRNGVLEETMMHIGEGGL